MKIFPFIFIITFALLSPGNAQANVGLPIISYGEPLMLFMFFPIFLIETIIYKKKLNVSLKDSALTSLWANTFTTILGYPLSWFLLLLYEIVVNFTAMGIEATGCLPDLNIPDIFIIILFLPAWLPPLYDIPLNITVCLLIMVGLIPAYYLSIREEYMIVKKRWGDNPKNKEACICANKVTYSLLLSVAIAMYFYFYLTPEP